MALSGTIKASSQGGDILVSFISGVSRPIPDFNNWHNQHLWTIYSNIVMNITGSYSEDRSLNSV